MKVVWLLLLFAYCSCLAKITQLNHWKLVDSEKVNQDGSEISTPGFDDWNWFSVSVPSTVLYGLLQNDVYTEPYYGKNLLNIPAKQFNRTWWYRTEFSASDSSNLFAHLRFHGINYKANVWLNGKLLADSSEVVGTFRYFDFDVSKFITWGPKNAIALEITRPFDRSLPDSNEDTDLAISFVDWDPYPPDGNMGLWREVELEFTGPVTIRYPMVDTKLSSTQTAHLTVMVELINTHTKSITGTLLGEIVGITQFSETVTLEPMKPKQIYFSNNTFEGLNIQNPSLWWPWQMGPQTMHTLNFNFTVGGLLSHSLSSRFGMREVSSELDDSGNRLYRVNGNPILIRGAGWSPELFLQFNAEKQQKEFDYVRDMNLNTIRLEGKFEDENYYRIADEMGILLMPGWCCCDAWQHWDAWSPQNYIIAAESLRSQVQRLRIHPSILVFMYSSDLLPTPEVEELFLKVFEEENWQNTIISTAGNHTSNITGPSGVKMSGPYSWVSPNYWLEDTNQAGGAFGFLTEGGPGENPMTYESLSWTIPNDHLWPMDDYWDFHCGNPLGMFHNLRFFTPPLYARYGNATSAADYLQKSQVASYESHRAMFEGYSRNKYTSTGLIQWMQNNAWPGMIWHLYDFYLNPGGSYFGTKRACEPIHIQYSYNDASIWIVNSWYIPISNLVATAQVFNLDGTKKYEYSQNVATMNADSAMSLFTIPQINGLSNTYFVRLQLHAHNGTVISNNFYWLSTTVDVLDWADSSWFRTPCSQYADFTELQTLPNLTLFYSSSSIEHNNQVTTTVKVKNPTNLVAFFIRLRITKGLNGKDVLPIIWDDNYFTLFAYESKILKATYSIADLEGQKPNVEVEIFNNISGGQ